MTKKNPPSDDTVSLKCENSHHSVLPNSTNNDSTKPNECEKKNLLEGTPVKGHHNTLEGQTEKELKSECKRENESEKQNENMAEAPNDRCESKILNQYESGGTDEMLFQETSPTVEAEYPEENDKPVARSKNQPFETDLVVINVNASESNSWEVQTTELKRAFENSTDVEKSLEKSFENVSLTVANSSSNGTSEKKHELHTEFKNVNATSIKKLNESIFDLRHEEWKSSDDMTETPFKEAQYSDSKRVKETEALANDDAKPACLEESVLRHRLFLEENIDPDSGFLDELFSRRMLSRIEFNKVKSKATFQERNAEILNYITEKHIHKDFVQTLRSVNQSHLANYLESNGVFRPCFGESWPLGEKELNILDCNHTFLIDHIEPDDFANNLFSKKVINRRHLSSLLSESNVHKKNDLLLEILRRRSLNDYRKTIECLHKSNQDHIARIFQDGGAVAEIHADVKPTSGSIYEAEKAIVAQITKLLKDKSSPEFDHIVELARLELFGVKIGCSVVNYFYCQTQQNFETLLELIKTGILQDSIASAYSRVLRSQEYVIVKLRWSEENQAVCRKSFGDVLSTSLSSSLKNLTPWGVAQFRGHLYVLCQEPNEVRIYDKQNQECAERISLSETRKPMDMVANRQDCCLYVADSANFCVWQVVVRERRVIRWMSGTSSPHTISMNRPGFLLMARWGAPSCLERYSANATLECRVELPTDIFNPLHSVETSSGNFIVLHTWKKSQMKGICEVNREGQIVRRFQPINSSEQPKDPRHLSCDSSGHVFLADFRGHTVLVIDSQLNRCGALTKDKDGIQLPRRLCYDEEEHKILIAQHSNKVDIYEVTPRSGMYRHRTGTNAQPIKSNSLENEEEKIGEEQEKELKKTYVSYIYEQNEDARLRQHLTSEDSRITSETKVDDLPLELFDMILTKAYLEMLLGRLRSNWRQNDKHQLVELMSVHYFWFRRMRRQRFKAAVIRTLTNFYRINRKTRATIRNNRTYLVASLQPKTLLRGMRLSSCLTDGQAQAISRLNDEKEKNEAICEVLSSTKDERFFSFIDCLRKTGQRLSARVLETGGACVKVTQRVTNRELVTHSLVEELNQLQDRNHCLSSEAEKLIDRLQNVGAEILGAVQDNGKRGKNGISVWLWCQSQTTLQKLEETDEQRNLFQLMKDIFKSLLSEKRMEMAEKTLMNIDRTHLEKHLVKRQLFVKRLKRFDVSTAVYGVTKLRDTFYFLCADPNSLRLYHDSASYDFLREITLTEITLPSDVAANHVYNCLYIVDQGLDSAVWKVEGDSHAMTRWSPAAEPFSMSVTSNGRVLMLKMGQPCRLELYNSQAVLVFDFPLTGNFVDVQHAVEASNGNFIVSLLPVQSDTWTIYELTKNGQIVRRFKPCDAPQGLNSPRRLALDRGDRVFVADYRNSRVILFNPQLTWNKILLSKSQDEIQDPTRMFIDQENKQLLVAQSVRAIRAIVDLFALSYR